MGENANADVSARSYPDTYYQQHRNSILFSAATALICLPNISVNLNEIVFVESSSELASHIIPWCIWIAATYSTLHFYLEWRDYAKPHGLSINSAIDQIRSDVQSMASQLKALGTLDKAIADVDEALSEFSSEASIDNERAALGSFQREVKETIAKNISDVRRSITKELGSENPHDNKLRAALVEIDAGYKNLFVQLNNIFALSRLHLSSQTLKSFQTEAGRTRNAILEIREELQAILAEPRWVKQQIDLTQRWVAIRVWLVGFAPPLALWVLATLLFVDSRLGSPGLDVIVGEPELHANLPMRPPS